MTNQPNGAELIRQALGPSVVIVPYVMPGFRLAKLAAEMFEGMPDAHGMVLLKHGLFTFAADARSSYERTIEYVDRAETLARSRARTRTVTVYRDDGSARTLSEADVMTSDDAGFEQAPLSRPFLGSRQHRVGIRTIVQRTGRADRPDQPRSRTSRGNRGN